MLINRFEANFWGLKRHRKRERSDFLFSEIRGSLQTFPNWALCLPFSYCMHAKRVKYIFFFNKNLWIFLLDTNSVAWNCLL